jgi:release factor glutamine methyltransferase
VTKINEVLSSARQQIPVAEARLLLAQASEQSPAWLVAHDQDELSDEVNARFAGWLARRAAGEPVAYILGWREFYGRRFKVGPGVLIPRPETELLVEQGLAAVAEVQRPRILDMGTGSGCIAISLALELPGAEVWALDFSVDALSIARENGRDLGADVRFMQSDWANSLSADEFSGFFDLIVSNPPYIALDDAHLSQGDLRFEPQSALAAAESGLADLQTVVSAAPNLLKPGGVLLCEHGYDQAVEMREVLSAQGFKPVQYEDLAGIVRVSGGRFGAHPNT